METVINLYWHVLLGSGPTRFISHVKKGHGEVTGLNEVAGLYFKELKSWQEPISLTRIEATVDSDTETWILSGSHGIAFARIRGEIRNFFNILEALLIFCVPEKFTRLSFRCNDLKHWEASFGGLREKLSERGNETGEALEKVPEEFSSAQTKGALREVKAHFVSSDSLKDLQVSANLRSEYCIQSYLERSSDIEEAKMEYFIAENALMGNNNWYQSMLLSTKSVKIIAINKMNKKDVEVKFPFPDKDNYHHWKVKMHLHLLSQDEAYVDCIERGPHVPMRAATGNKPSVRKPRHEWSNPNIEQVRKYKKAMNILFNGVDGDMFDNIINCKTTKKEFTLERLYGILKTYELEIEQDERMEKGRKKGGSIALVAELEKEKEMKVEAVESTSKRFAKLKFKKNFGAAKPNRDMVDK
ncbi:hypothetical protein AgCh_009975 [Apium graveolens]